MARVWGANFCWTTLGEGTGHPFIWHSPFLAQFTGLSPCINLQLLKSLTESQQTPFCWRGAEALTSERGKMQLKICSWPLRQSHTTDPRETQLCSMPLTWEGGHNLEYPSLCLHDAPRAHNVRPVLLSALPAFPSITDNLLVSECTYYRTVRGVFVSTTR